jgi:hypothetical protein
MADIRVKSTGKEFRRIDNGTAQLLEEMFPEALERINNANTLGTAGDAPLARVTASMETEWGIWRAPVTGKPAIQGKNFRTTMYFDGDPNRASAFNVGGKFPPPEVIEAYRAAYIVGDAYNSAEGAAEKRRREADEIYAQGGGILPVKE